MPPIDNQNPQPPIWQQPSQPPLYPPPVAPPQSEPQLPEPQGPTPGYTQSTPEPSRKKLWIVLGCVLIAVMVAVTGYMTVRNAKESSQPENTTDTTQPIESLNAATLLPPADLSGYQPNPENNGLNMQYATADNACMLHLGVAGSTELPGKDFDEITQNLVKKLRDSGAAVQGPTGGTPVKAKDVTDDHKVYTMPTAVFTASKEGSYKATHYSVAILKDGSRVFAERSCETKDALVSPAKLDTLDKDLESGGVLVQ
jgi:hypothetical protein